jgi:hypothetical protein
VLDSVPDQRVRATESLTIDFSAHDADGDAISFFAQEKDGVDVPPRSTITDHHNGTATFQWSTTPQDAGDRKLRVAAFDEGGGEMFQDVKITVFTDASSVCIGDCNGDKQVTIDELLKGVSIALGDAPSEACTAFQSDITVVDLIAAVSNALGGCDGIP